MIVGEGKIHPITRIHFTSVTYDCCRPTLKAPLCTLGVKINEKLWLLNLGYWLLRLRLLLAIVVFRNVGSTIIKDCVMAFRNHAIFHKTASRRTTTTTSGLRVLCPTVAVIYPPPRESESNPNFNWALRLYCGFSRWIDPSYRRKEVFISQFLSSTIYSKILLLILEFFKYFRSYTKNFLRLLEVLSLIISISLFLSHMMTKPHSKLIKYTHIHGRYCNSHISWFERTTGPWSTEASQWVLANKL